MVEKTGTDLVKYYYAENILVAKSNSNATAFVVYWYHSDHLGSVRMLTDDGGFEVNTYDFAAFGETVAQSGSAPNNRGYTGHIEDPDLGLIYMQARYYDAVLGRFLSPDTIIPDLENPQALNRYTYVLNNPINNIDPTGNRPFKQNEIDMFNLVYRGAIDFTILEIVQTNLNTSYAINDVHMETIYYSDDYTQESVPTQALVVHELSHINVGQNSEISGYTFGATVGLGITHVWTTFTGHNQDLYNYIIDPNKSIWDYEPEARAEIFEDYWIYSNGHYIKSRPPMTPTLFAEYEKLIFTGITEINSYNNELKYQNIEPEINAFIMSEFENAHYYPSAWWD